MDTLYGLGDKPKYLFDETLSTVENDALTYNLGEHIVQIKKEKEKKPIILQENTKGDTNIFAPHIYVKKKPTDYKKDYFNPRSEFQ